MHDNNVSRLAIVLGFPSGGLRFESWGDASGFTPVVRGFLRIGGLLFGVTKVVVTAGGAIAVLTDPPSTNLTPPKVPYFSEVCISVAKAAHDSRSDMDPNIRRPFKEEMLCGRRLIPVNAISNSFKHSKFPSSSGSFSTRRQKRRSKYLKHFMLLMLFGISSKDSHFASFSFSKHSNCPISSGNF
ncbi:hypothetical protein LXL04_010667 [Taraxacum kok-saghyz]